jgi:hypothetical protein
MPGNEPAPADAARRELDAGPPFLSWAALYLLVAVLLALEIATFAVITVAYR